MEHTTQLWFFGAGRVEVANQGVQVFKSRRALALLGYLATHHEALPRTQLASLFWPDHPDERSRGNLRYELHHLAVHVPHCLAVDRQTVRLLGAPSCWTDIAAFEQFIAQNTVTALAAAAELYRGPFLDGLYLDDCPEVETWLAQEREHWHEQVAHLLMDLTVRYRERREWITGLRTVDRLLVLDPWRETAHQEKMRLLALSGQRDSALSQYETCRRVLVDELGLAPSSETTTLYEQIRDGFLVASAAPELHRFHIPIPPTPLLGRGDERALITHLLAQPQCRLLTLLGSGGVGKTRLAFEIALEQQAHFVDGVCVVELASIQDPMLVSAIIAQSLGLPEGDDRPVIERLKDWLRDKKLLLYLDNFEQVLEAAPLVRDLLAASPQLKILVTSRMSLHLRGEQEYQVNPLALPPVTSNDRWRNDDDAREALGRYSVVELFVQRAQHVKPDFQLTIANAPAVAEICARLDGLPLAIELAAARIKLFSPSVLLTRMDRRLPLLTGGARDLPTHQRTLRDTIAWSYHLLAPAEQRLFRSLGVFAGGGTIEMIEAMIADTFPQELALLDVLEPLVDGSLLREESSHDGTTRLTMLETIREYALEEGAKAGELAELRRRHAQVFLTLIEAAQPHLQDWQQEVWLDRLETEHDNLRAILIWSRTPEGNPAVGLHLVEVLWAFWLARGHVGEGRVWIAALLELPNIQATMSTRAHVLTGAGRLAWAQNDWPQATTFFEASRALFQAVDNQAGYANALHYLAEVAAAQGDYKQAAPLFTHSLELFQQLGDQENSAGVLSGYGQMMLAQGQHDRAAELVAQSIHTFEVLGNRLRDPQGYASALTVQGQIMRRLGTYASADHLFGRSLELYRRMGNRLGIIWALTNHGQSLLEQKEYERAEQIFAQSLVFYQELGDQRGQAWALVNQGHSAQAQVDHIHALALFERGTALLDALGDQRGHAWAGYHAGRSMHALGNYISAAQRFKESLQIFHTLDDNWFMIACLSGLGAACTALDHPYVAVRLFAVAETIHTHAPSIVTSAEDTANLNTLRQSVPDAAFTAAWEAGRAMTVEEALDWVQMIIP